MKDIVGDCHAFAGNLAKYMSEKNLIEFRYNTRVTQLLSSDNGRISAIVTESGEKMEADAYVVCLGPQSSYLLQQVNKYVPIYPVRGYSLTAPIRTDEEQVLNSIPRGIVVDPALHFYTSRMGDRVRFTSVAEFSGQWNLPHAPSTYTIKDLNEPDPEDISSDAIKARSRMREMVKLVRLFYPTICDYEKGFVWMGLRPMTPDTMPIVSPCYFQSNQKEKSTNLFLNAGHGVFGWKLACASAAIVSDMVVGQEMKLNVEGLSLDRFN